MPSSGDYLNDRFPFPAINSGLVPGVRTFSVIGYNAALSSGVEALLWPATPTTYVWPTRTGELMKLFSANPADVGVPVLIQGLDGSGVPQNEVVLVGSVATPTQTVNTFGRINFMINVGAQNLVGDVSLTSLDGLNLYSFILAGNNRSTQLVFTVPENASGFFLASDATINSAASSGDSAIIKVWVRAKGGVFSLAGRWGLQKQGSSGNTFSIEDKPRLLPGLDVYVTATASANGVDVSGRVPIILFDADGGNILT